MHVEVSGEVCKTVEDVNWTRNRGKTDDSKIAGARSRGIGQTWTQSQRK